MSTVFAKILKDIVVSLNRGFFSMVYDLPYALDPDELAALIELVDNAPVACQLDFFDPAPLTYKSSDFVVQFRITNLEFDD